MGAERESLAWGAGVGSNVACRVAVKWACRSKDGRVAVKRAHRSKDGRIAVRGRVASR